MRNYGDEGNDNESKWSYVTGFLFLSSLIEYTYL